MRVWSGGAGAQLAYHTPCVIELAPGCGHHVSEVGVDISRGFLLRLLPAALVAADHIRPTLNLLTRLDRVAPADECHCALRWHNGWRLCAHHPVVCGRTVYESGGLIELARSTSLLLGVDGWPITIRINETHIPL